MLKCLSRMVSHRFLVALPLTLVITGLLAASALAAGTGSAVTQGQVAGPPNGIITCDWIASHPTQAAQAHVTCDPAVFFAALSTPSSTLTPELKPLSYACPDVPNGYRVGKDVYAWSDFYYSYTWSWKGNWSPSDYVWYIQDAPASTVLWSHEYDTSWHSVGASLAEKYYRWGAQNKSDTPQSWQTCYYG